MMVLECHAKGSGLHPEGGGEPQSVRQEDPDQIWL